jgi:predicted nucleotidyltransferase
MLYAERNRQKISTKNKPIFMQLTMRIKIQNHKQLLKELWTPEQALRPRVRDVMLKIARVYLEKLSMTVGRKINLEQDVEQVIFCGSCADFCYDKSSDLDLHIFMDFKKVNDTLGFDSWAGIVSLIGKDLSDKFNPKIYNRKVDVHVFDINYSGYKDPATGRVSYSLAAAFSLLHNRWLNMPQRLAGFEMEQVRKQAGIIAEDMKKSAEYVMKNKLGALEASALLKKFGNARYTACIDDELHSKGPIATAYSAVRRKKILKRLIDYRNSDTGKALSIG